MPRYRVMHRINKMWWEGEAPSAQEACQKAGWIVGDCWVRQYSSKGMGGWKLPDDNPELGRLKRGKVVQ